MTCKQIKEWVWEWGKFEFVSSMYPWKYDDDDDHDDVIASRQIGHDIN